MAAPTQATLKVNGTAMTPTMSAPAMVTKNAAVKHLGGSFFSFAAFAGIALFAW